MESDLQAKFIKYLNSRNLSAGFTLIEVLVVIIIIGILTAIGLPFFISRTANAKQSEAQHYVNQVNKAQQTYRAEHNNFGDSFDKLAIGVLDGGDRDETNHYIYEITSGTATATISAQAKDTLLRGYYGSTLHHTNASGYIAISSVVCEATTPGDAAPGVGTFGTYTPNCPDDYIPLSR